MVNVSQKSIGHILIGVSLILLVLLIMVKSNIDKEQAFLCELTHATPGMDIEQCPAHQSNTSWLLVATFGITFLILFSGIYLRFSTRTLAHKKVSVSKLSKDEKTIHDFLQKNDGSMYQSDLIKETGFSKVHITRTLDKMEGKNIIDRKRRGMTNIIILK